MNVAVRPNVNAVRSTQNADVPSTERNARRCWDLTVGQQKQPSNSQRMSEESTNASTQLGFFVTGGPDSRGANNLGDTPQIRFVNISGIYSSSLGVRTPEPRPATPLRRDASNKVLSLRVCFYMHCSRYVRSTNVPRVKPASKYCSRQPSLPLLDRNLRRKSNTKSRELSHLRTDALSIGISSSPVSYENFISE